MHTHTLAQRAVSSASASSSSSSSSDASVVVLRKATPTSADRGTVRDYSPPASPPLAPALRATSGGSALTELRGISALRLGSPASSFSSLAPQAGPPSSGSAKVSFCSASTSASAACIAPITPGSSIEDAAASGGKAVTQPMQPLPGVADDAITASDAPASRGIRALSVPNVSFASPEDKGKTFGPHAEPRRRRSAASVRSLSTLSLRIDTSPVAEGPFPKPAFMASSSSSSSTSVAPDAADDMAGIFRTECDCLVCKTVLTPPVPSDALANGQAHHPRHQHLRQSESQEQTSPGVEGDDGTMARPGSLLSPTKSGTFAERDLSLAERMRIAAYRVAVARRELSSWASSMSSPNLFSDPPEPVGFPSAEIAASSASPTLADKYPPALASAASGSSTEAGQIGASQPPSQTESSARKPPRMGLGISIPAPPSATPTVVAVATEGDGTAAWETSSLGSENLDDKAKQEKEHKEDEEEERLRRLGNRALSRWLSGEMDLPPLPSAHLSVASPSLPSLSSSSSSATSASGMILAAAASASASASGSGFVAFGGPPFSPSRKLSSPFPSAGSARSLSSTKGSFDRLRRTSLPVVGFPISASLSSPSPSASDDDDEEIENDEDNKSDLDYGDDDDDAAFPMTSSGSSVGAALEPPSSPARRSGMARYFDAEAGEDSLTDLLPEWYTPSHHDRLEQKRRDSASALAVGMDPSSSTSLSSASAIPGESGVAAARVKAYFVHKPSPRQDPFTLPVVGPLSPVRSSSSFPGSASWGFEEDEACVDDAAFRGPRIVEIQSPRRTPGRSVAAGSHGRGACGYEGEDEGM